MGLSLHDHFTIFFTILIKSGLPLTLKLVLGSFLGACAIGLAGGVIRGLKIPVLDQILGLYAQLCRGIPDMLVLLFFYAVMVYGSTYSISVLAISVIQGAYMQEIIKGGILSIDKGQWEAARAMSLPVPVVLFRIVIPQVMLIAMPALIGQVVLLIKGTSVASTIGCLELTKRGVIAMARFSNALVVYGYILIIFFILCHALTMLGRRVERKVTRKVMGDLYE
ncbi:MAG: amino acid ABC transporter permease [Clostridiales Family XIII bacterium]|jgi:His/Glu/Gln/Arg/opine family amino acid ABC transporter permease subunit|nr:amino acid ABC transporter permease [Clostridiales Family XIII bacterium]